MHLPTFAGKIKILCSTYDYFFKKELIPTTPLPHYHPFWSLWQDHLTSIQSQGANDLIDALVAIWLQDPQWTSKMLPNKVDDHMRHLLSDSPPHVLILAGIPRSEWSYSAFLRGRKSWQFICLNEAYVDLWQDAEDDVERLALTALLRAALDHELGHWVQCIASGSFSSKANNLKTLTNWKRTPTFFSSSWCRKEDEGEAGQWVEFCSRGGILDYDTIGRKAILVTGSEQQQDLSSSDLDQYRSGTAFPSKITPRNPPLNIKLGPSESSSKTARNKVLFSTRNAGCFQSTPGMPRHGCCLKDSLK